MKRVYFIKPIGMSGPIKIGCSASPVRRKGSLETWSPFPLEIVAEVEGDFDLEQRFHALLIASHERREWFKATPEVLAVVASVSAGTFDVATLPKPRGVASYVAGKKQSRTIEQRRDLSYSLRISHTRSRSGYSFPIAHYGMVKRGDHALIAAVDRFLADPASCGVPITAPWAAKARVATEAKVRAFMAAYSPAEAPRTVEGRSMSAGIPTREVMDAQARAYRLHPFTAAQEARVREMIDEPIAAGSPSFVAHVIRTASRHLARRPEARRA